MSQYLKNKTFSRKKLYKLIFESSQSFFKTVFYQNASLVFVLESATQNVSLYHHFLHIPSHISLPGWTRSIQFSFALVKQNGPVTNNENINIDGSKWLTSTTVSTPRNINIDGSKWLTSKGNNIDSVTEY